MKMSGLSDEEIKKLNYNQIEKAVYSDCPLTRQKYTFGIVLGGRPFVCIPRAEKAAELYRLGITDKLIASGGARWFVHGRLLSESKLLKKELLKQGVIKKDIICENCSKNTEENFRYSKSVILQHASSRDDVSVLIITSASHLKRSLSIARKILPENVTVDAVYAEGTDDYPGKWMKNEVIRERVLTELSYYRDLIVSGKMDDIEID